jgi:transposase-like protein
MSLWARYYLAIAVFFVALMGGNFLAFTLNQFWLVYITVPVAVLSYGYCVIAACPHCGRRLMRTYTWYSHGLPGGHCQGCGYNLRDSAKPQISN